ncbi:LPXTG cell wall anchor domain-containing protein [Actinoplanes sp. GCM10030250]|uniref:LPXTG cell wall anchor domain-containing protein n=1 Tax=Actinoplanes sp. GCM10030250 TaxID=3273376 RepID=UPI00361B55F2
MSFSRRLAAGLPAVGVTVFAALAFAGSPATAAETTVEVAYPAVMTTPSADTRGNDGYTGDVSEVPGGTAAATTPAAPADEVPGDDRGNPGYTATTTAPPTSTPPTSTPPSSPAPSGSVSDAVAPPASNGPGGTGLLNAKTLPLTGAPLTGTLVAGGVMVAAGVAAVWYTRRRRTA